MRYTPDNITELADGEIFVFGSNTAGRHGAGAALTAKRLFGAKQGVGEGRTGQCYALPTVGYSKRLGLVYMRTDKVRIYVGKFKTAAAAHPELTFLVTLVGCGLARHTVAEIAPMFLDAPANCVLPEVFVRHNEGRKG